MKSKLNSKEWFSISTALFLSLLVFVSGIGIDARHTVLAKKNLFEGIAKLFSIPVMDGSDKIFIMLLCLCAFIVLVPFTLIAIKRYFKSQNESLTSSKAYLFYITDIVVILAVLFGLGIIFQLPNGGIATINTTMKYVLGSLAIGLFLFLVISMFIYACVGIIYYFFLNKKEAKDDSLVSDGLSEEEKEENHDLSSSFSDASKIEGGIVTNGINASSNESYSIGNRELGNKEFVFRNLVAIDEDPSLITAGDFSDDNITLDYLLNGLQGYLAKEHHLYYDKKELVAFISGLSASKFIILEGVSGTGKSSLPRYFAKYIGEEAYFEPIQVTYREKSDIVGFYNEITGKYNETPFLKKLYRSSYETNKINLMVLDEMNISRIEYYFADFLSVMEFPVNERYISLMSLPLDYEAPLNLIGGQLLISPNTYFIGTANKDDSTFTITDKVIDRSIVINFDETQKEIDIDGEYNPISLSYNQLEQLFNNAREQYPLSNEDKNKLLVVLDAINNECGIVTGNRIIKQIVDMSSIYLALGYKACDCFDQVISSKILRKLENKYDKGLANSLNNLLKILDNVYSSDDFVNCKKIINKILRRII